MRKSSKLKRQRVNPKEYYAPYQLFGQEENALEYHENDQVVDMNVDPQRERANFEEEKLQDPQGRRNRMYQDLDFVEFRRNQRRYSE